MQSISVVPYLPEEAQRPTPHRRRTLQHAPGRRASGDVHVAGEALLELLELVEELRAMEVAHEVLGGGRIQFEPEKKTIHIYGHSMGFPWQGEYRHDCLLYTSPSPRDKRQSRMPSSA